MKKNNFISKNKKVFIGVLIGALIVIIFVIASLIENSSESKALYGSRLDGIEEVEITKKDKKNIIDNIKASNVTKSVEVEVRGKIINVFIEIVPELSREDSKSLANKVLEKLSDDKKTFYDIQVFIDKKDASEFPIIGYHHHSKEGFSWTLDR